MPDSEPQSLVGGFSEQLQRHTRGLNVVLPQHESGDAVVKADLSRLEVVDGKLPGEAELRVVLADEDDSRRSNLFLGPGNNTGRNGNTQVLTWILGSYKRGSLVHLTQAPTRNILPVNQGGVWWDEQGRSE